MICNWPDQWLPDTDGSQENTRHGIKEAMAKGHEHCWKSLYLGTSTCNLGTARQEDREEQPLLHIQRKPLFGQGWHSIHTSATCHTVSRCVIWWSSLLTSTLNKGHFLFAFVILLQDEEWEGGCMRDPHRPHPYLPVHSSVYWHLPALPPGAHVAPGQKNLGSCLSQRYYIWDIFLGELLLVLQFKTVSPSSSPCPAV